MTEDRDSIERQVRATMSEGQAVRQRARQEFTELERLLKHEAAPTTDDDASKREEVVPWWRKFLSD